LKHNEQVEKTETTVSDYLTNIFCNSLQVKKRPPISFCAGFAQAEIASNTIP